MGSFGLIHWAIVLLVVILIFGTKKLKDVGRDVSGTLRGFRDGMRDDQVVEQLSEAEVHARVGAFAQARREGNFVEADRLCDELAGHGIALRDSAQGTTWTRG